MPNMSSKAHLEPSNAVSGFMERIKPSRAIRPVGPRNPVDLVLSVQDRSLLRLLYRRGATQRELAGAMGISRAALRRRLRRVRQKAADPVLIGLALLWRRLPPADRHLAYLHYVVEMSTAEIVRRGLADGVPGRNGHGPSGTTLRRRLRKIAGKAKLAARRRLSRRSADAQPSASAG